MRQDPVTLQSGPIHRHRLGEPVAHDTLVHDEPDKTLSATLARSASRRYLVIALSGTDTSETRVVDADAPDSPARVVLARRAQVRFDADHLDGHWFIRTNEGAPNFRLVRAPDAAPADRGTWHELVPAREQTALEAFALTRQGIALEERVRTDKRVRLLRDGHAIEVHAPEAVSVALGSNRDPDAAHLRYTVTSMVQPRATWDWHLASGRRLLRQTQPVPGYDAARYATQRLWAAARDGQRVPVTLAWRVDRTRADGSAALLLLGYGAYGDSYDATFVPDRVSLLDRGFVVAIAHVRGGAELGQAWYENGRLMNKHNTFNDFVDATDGLVKAGWGDPRRVFASGGSAGGLLMGVVANQAGQRYRGIVLDVPFVDAVTTMLDETIPLTANEWTQWGDPREKAAYDYMLAYSPYDNIAARPYPAMLVSTGLQDSQVQYYEPAKYVARLRATKTDDKPLLLHVNMQAGHGGVSGRYASLADVAREYAFLIDLAQAQPQLLARMPAPATVQTSAQAPPPRPAPTR
jgi:oligopeptidase B